MAAICNECHMRPVEYTTTKTGFEGGRKLCRDCFEKIAARTPRDGRARNSGRNSEQMENERETRYGVDY